MMAGQEEGERDGDVPTDDLAEPNNPRFQVYGSRHFYSKYHVDANKRAVETEEGTKPSGPTSIRDSSAGIPRIGLPMRMAGCERGPRWSMAPDWP